MLKNIAAVICLSLHLQFCQTAIALDSNPHPQEPGQKPTVVQKGDNENDEPILSPECIEIAELTGVLQLCKKLDAEQKKAKTAPPTNDSERIIQNQRLIYLHTQINQAMHTADLEVNSVTGKMNSGMAQLADRQASISDARARSLRRNNFINLISGGMTKIGGYTTALTDASAIPTNVLEVFDGGVQTTLSALTMKQLRAEAELSKEKPQILTTFLNDSNSATKIFPESVWTYLLHKDPTAQTVSTSNASPKTLNGSTQNTSIQSATISKTSEQDKTRRRVLMDYWVREGRLKTSNAGKNGGTRRTKEMAGVKMPLNDLDDTVSMMSDLKSVVASMENSLMELSQVLKKSYKDDPEI